MRLSAPSRKTIALRATNDVRVGGGGTSDGEDEGEGEELQGQDEDGGEEAGGARRRKSQTRGAGKERGETGAGSAGTLYGARQIQSDRRAVVEGAFVVDDVIGGAGSWIRFRDGAYRN